MFCTYFWFNSHILEIVSSFAYYCRFKRDHFTTIIKTAWFLRIKEDRQNLNTFWDKNSISSILIILVLSLSKNFTLITLLHDTGMWKEVWRSDNTGSKTNSIYIYKRRFIIFIYHLKFSRLYRMTHVALQFSIFINHTYKWKYIFCDALAFIKGNIFQTFLLFI